MKRPYVLTIAGHDPSGGAGLIADCKVFEQMHTIGLSVCTAITVQTESEFHSVNWLEEDLIIAQTRCMLQKYQPKVIKIGLVPSFAILEKLLKEIHSIVKAVQIIWDPILKSSSGFTFHNVANHKEALLRKITLITPNCIEANQLWGTENQIELQEFCRSSKSKILLKGGHSTIEKGVDFLISSEAIQRVEPKTMQPIYDKHGTGCMLSASIAASLAKNNSLIESCRIAKEYVEKRMIQNSSLLAWHS